MIVRTSGDLKVIAAMQTIIAEVYAYIPSYNLKYSIAVLTFWDYKVDLSSTLGAGCNVDLTGRELDFVNKTTEEAHQAHLSPVLGYVHIQRSPYSIIAVHV